MYQALTFWLGLLFIYPLVIADFNTSFTAHFLIIKFVILDIYDNSYKYLDQPIQVFILNNDKILGRFGINRYANKMVCQ
ncbi:hypothetical protein A1QC_14410 [Vibrio rumoiensis 1S-45]|uniref:Uncharacterized protein n=1 Tax=Vibrio rumoiensis 1S-45 TaxID=1188252 RepID=A0A1E5E4Q9_9VIBR|nr:hypothetical protein A1QC_14410 [Vibrio rumoiensis 1S-45]